MSRKCRLKSCRRELPKAKDCVDAFQKGGFCDINCMAKHGLEKSRESKDKAERKKQRERREAIKTKSTYAKEAQAAFNKYIRLRDHSEPCISCGRHHQGQYHAGHYRTVGGHPELRFEELNCHKQCSVCNNHKSGNIVEYRINLLKRIGADRLNWLEGPHEPRKYAINELKEIKKEYAKKARDLEKEAAN